ncbi:MAG TPA: hypothetical protein VLH40_01490 [Atribacteraceae bacterium]|nr:hypothetical protein [Atribacteraceae bacterium]
MTVFRRASQANPLSGEPGHEPGQQPTFIAFSEGTLLESDKVPIAEIAELALREGQCPNPIYRIHRWFARRFGSQLCTWVWRRLGGCGLIKNIKL